MKYALLDENKKVKQIQPYSENGFIEVDDYVTCGMVMNIDGTFSIHKTFADLKAEKLAQLAANFGAKTLRPRVDVPSLGYAVDGNREDLDNFKNGRDIAYHSIKDADNIIHPATLADYDSIIQAIQLNGGALIGWMWAKKEEINAIIISDTVSEAEAIATLEMVVIA